MTIVEQSPQRLGKRQSAPAKADKIQSRRNELADAALETLAELGYARTSLREIAQKSEFTHGVLHYYFADKVDLICCGVRQYKARCVTRYDDLIATSTSREALLDGFLEKLGDTLKNEPKLHRLWYDLRSQALFDTAFQRDVAEIDASLENMIWRVAVRYSELGNRRVSVSKTLLYAAFDGLFQKHLLRLLSNDPDAVHDLLVEVRRLMPVVA